MKNSDIPDCDLFDFMAEYVGITSLHPGGKEASRLMARACHLENNQQVLDVGCGKGTSPCYFARKFHCRVTGIDHSAHFIDTANQMAARKQLQNNLNFKVALAQKLPFENNAFDVVISQALLVMVEDDIKDQIIRESIRTLKSHGHLGFLELSWFQTPPADVLEHIATLLHREYVGHVMTFEEWEKNFKSYGLRHISTQKKTVGGGIFRFFEDEGVKNGVKVMWRIMTNPNFKKKLLNAWKAFSNYNDYLGYGIYCFRKD